MSRFKRGIPFVGQVPRPSDRSRAADRMDLLLRRAEQDSADETVQNFTFEAPAFEAPALEATAFEPPDVSPWSSADGEPELRQALGNSVQDEEPWPAEGDENPWNAYTDFDDVPPTAAQHGHNPEDLASQSPSSIDPLIHEPAPSMIDLPTLQRGRRGAAARDLERNVLPFRRRSQQRRIRRLRRHPLVRWIGPLVTAMFILAIPLSVIGWFLASPSFALQDITVVGEDAQRVDPDWVLGTLGGFKGGNIWLLPLDRAEAVLLSHPWIDDVALRKHPPHHLEVRIVERREAALYRDQEQGLIYVDAEGRRIAPWSKSKDSGDLPILSGRGEETHLAAAIELVSEIHAAGPPWAVGLSEIEILSELDYRLYTRDLPFPLLVRSGTVDGKARHLQALLPRILDRFEAVGAVDLRFARRIIIEPVSSGSRRS